MRRVIVKGRERDYITPWIYKKRIREGEAEPGEAVVVYTAAGKRVGSALYNPHSKIALRLYSREERPLDYGLIKERLILLDRERQRFFPGETCYRLAFGDVDGLPGLVVDRYDRGFVIQILSLGMELRRREVVEALIDAFDPLFIYERSDSVLRQEEGLERRSGLLYGEVPDPFVVEILGVRYEIDVRQGQKTGFYLDQRENRAIVGRYGRGRKLALDLFAYTGGFTLHLLREGVEKVYAVDRSEEALALLRRNLALNGLPKDRVVLFARDVFDFLQEMTLSPVRFDLIVLDPPGFAKGRETVEGARRGYLALHHKALDILAPGGVVATFTCSYHVSEELLLSTFFEAARARGRRFKIREFLRQSKDHPVLVGFPESFYLKGFVLEETEP